MRKIALISFSESQNFISLVFSVLTKILQNFNWNLTADDNTWILFLRQFSAAFVSISTQTSRFPSTDFINKFSLSYQEWLFLANVAVNHNVHTFIVILHGEWVNSFLINVEFTCLLIKVIIEKSRGEVSLMGQDTIENVS